MVAGAEAADGTDALGEGADDEVAFLLEAGLFGEAAAVAPEHTEGMRLVDEQLKAAAALHLDELGQRRPIAEHRINALEHHQPAALVVGAGEPAVEVLGVVVAEAYQLGARQRASVIDRGMRIGVEIDRVLGAGQAGDHAEIGLVAGREDDAVAAPEKVGELALEREMHVIGAIGDARAGGAGAERGQRLLPGGDAGRLERHPHVIVGAGEDGLAPVDDGAGRRDHLAVAHPQRIGPEISERCPALHQPAMLVEEILHAQAARMVRSATTFTRSSIERVSESTFKGMSISK